MRRERPRVRHRPPDAAWLDAELTAIGALIEAGRPTAAVERARAAVDELPPRACGSRFPASQAQPPCAACQAVDDAGMAIGVLELRARIAGPLPGPLPGPLGPCAGRLMPAG